MKIIILAALYLLGVFIMPLIAFLFKNDIDDYDLICLAAWAWPIVPFIIAIYFLFSLPARIYNWLDISFDKDEYEDNSEDNSNMIPPIFNKRS